MRKDRLELYKQLEIERNSKLLVYITSTRDVLGTQIANDILPKFIEHLDKIGDTQKITLYLFTNGGDTLAAWSLVNLIRSLSLNRIILIILSNLTLLSIICITTFSKEITVSCKENYNKLSVLFF